jgi:hypothetical protein
METERLVMATAVIPISHIQFGIAISPKSVFIAFSSLIKDEQLRQDLLNQMLKLNEKRKDYQEVTPVEDIIDPDLGPFRINSDYISRKSAQLKELKSRGLDVYRKLKDFNWDAPTMVLSDFVKVFPKFRRKFILGERDLSLASERIFGDER